MSEPFIPIREDADPELSAEYDDDAFEESNSDLSPKASAFLAACYRLGLTDDDIIALLEKVKNKREGKP